VLEEIPGHGIRGEAEGKQLLCGSLGLLERFGVEVPALESAPGTQVLVAIDGLYAGRILLWDTVKKEAEQAVKTLQKKGITTAMLTGDREDSAAAVAKKLGIQRVFARLLPQNKLEVVQQLRAEYGPVMFVGDGINDAPVLAGADVGAAMGSGADAAIEAADVVFLTSRADAIGKAHAISVATKRIAWQNVVFALAVKLLVMVLGLLGFAQLWLAVFADTGVAILCVLNSIRLLYRK
jgi:Cd2+/Zn2+-exporting ATPase